MPANIEGTQVENMPHRAYDESIEVRLAALETEVAVMQNNFATRDDLQALRAEMHAGFDRVTAAFNDHKLEVYAAIGKLREEVGTALSNQRIDFNAALGQLHEEFSVALIKQREELSVALIKQREELSAALSKQRDEFNAALNKQRDEFNASFAKQEIELHKILQSLAWKIYGFASLLATGAYFIARYVH